MARPRGQRKFADTAGDIAPVVLGLFVALLGTDPFNLRGKSHLLTTLYKLSLGLWIATVLILASTVALPSRSTGGRPLRGIATAVCGTAALVVTVVMLSLLGSRWATDRDHVQVALAPANRVALDQLCGIAKTKELDGQIPTGSLNDPFIVLTLDSGLSNRCDDVRIPVASIRALREIH